MIFDIIGDIHGHARALEGLLEMLGYREHGGVYRSSESGRMALFVGDIVDRGPQIPRALQIVRNMVDEGEARMVLGNHEYNLVAWYTPLSAERRAQVEKEYGPIEGPLYVRPRTERHAKQCEQTILQFAGQENVLKDYLEWMQQQPLFLDLPDLRIVHAAWHPQAAATVKEYSPTEHRLTDQLLHASSFPGSPGYLAIEYLLKGVEVSLPPGMFYHDKEGAVRRRSRTAWWQRPEGHEMSLSSLIFPPDLDSSGDLSSCLVPSDSLEHIPGYANDKPVFMGHYWLDGQPQCISPMVCCLDYSIAAGGKLVSYRYEGELSLENNRFSAVDVHGKPCALN